ncbi:MAG: ribonuclease J [Patescibacteria group bacterium]
MDDKLKVITLGGVEEVGINSTIVELGNDIIVIDFGLGFSEDNLYGIDFLIPNFEYLQNNKDKIRGFVITHGHLDHIGGLAYVLDKLGNPPIYGTKMTVEIIKEKLTDRSIGLKNKARIIEFSPEDKFNLGAFSMSFFRVNHNIPDSVGIIVGTKFGNLVHTGDFKFDNTPFEEPVTQYHKITKVGEEGVLLLMSDSTNANKSGMSVSESAITPILENIMIHSEGRIIAATFSSLLTRVNQLVSLSHKYGRKVAISGLSMEKTIKIAKNLGYLDVPKDTFIKISDTSKYPDNEILIITTGAQGEENAGLMRMILGDHAQISIKKEDTVILSSSVIPTNAALVQKLLDYIVGSGANVIHQSIMDVHAGGHAHQEDHKLLLNLIKPRYFMPIEGYQSFLDSHKKTAKSVGIKEDKILMPKNGSVFEYQEGKGFVQGERITHVPVRIANNLLGDIGNKVMKEREQLSENGILLININIDAQKKMIGTPNIISRGFIFSKENYKLIRYIEENINFMFKDKIYEKIPDPQDMRNTIAKSVSTMLVEKYGKNPLVLVVLSQ